MQDTDKDASETVIEGEATPLGGRKKASRNKSNHTNQLGSSPARTLFSLRNLIGLFMFSLAAIGSSYWVLNNLIPPSQDSLEFSKTINEVTERALQTKLKLAELKEQVDKLETNTGSLKEYIEAESQDVNPEAFIVRLDDLEARFKDLSNEITRTQMEGREPLEYINSGSYLIKQFLDSIWVDSQTGKSLITYRRLIDTLKSNSVEDKPDEVLLSIERVLNGNLSSHARLLNELNQKILEDFTDSALYHTTLKPADKTKIKTDREIKTNRTEDTSKTSAPSWTQYFAKLFNLRKLSNDNATQSDSKGRQEFNRDEAAKKTLLILANQTIQRANQIPETLSEAIIYLKEVLDNDTLKISSQQLSKLKKHLSQIKSRQRVDEMIDEIYQSYGLLSKKGKP